jgi:hypothetical protein
MAPHPGAAHGHGMRVFGHQTAFSRQQALFIKHNNEDTSRDHYYGKQLATRSRDCDRNNQSWLPWRRI